MSHNIKPLAVHPPPDPDKSIGRWIEEIAKANRTSFKVMFFHIVDAAKMVGFLEALAILTRVPIETITKLENEFKPEFWKDILECPIKKCPHIATTPTGAFNHIEQRHPDECLEKCMTIDYF